MEVTADIDPYDFVIVIDNYQKIIRFFIFTLKHLNLFSDKNQIEQRFLNTEFSDQFYKY
jgi:hypothetical protein